MPMNGDNSPGMRMLKGKRLLVKRLRQEIVAEREAVERRVVKIEGRIRIAQALISALEKGALKL